MADGLEPFRESLWLGSLAYLADAAAALGDEDVAALVYPELEPFGGGNVMIGHLVSCYGAADRYLGMLATTLGEWERAQEHFERATGAEPVDGRRDLGGPHRRTSTPAWSWRGPVAIGPMPRRCCGEAAELAERIGMRGLLERSRALGGRRPATVLPAGLSPREVQILVLVAQGHTTDRSERRCRSASTRPPITFAAS